MPVEHVIKKRLRCTDRNTNFQATSDDKHYGEICYFDKYAELPVEATIPETKRGYSSTYLRQVNGPYKGLVAESLLRKSRKSFRQRRIIIELLNTESQEKSSRLVHKKVLIHHENTLSQSSPVVFCRLVPVPQ